VVTTKCGKDYDSFYKCGEQILQGIYDKLMTMNLKIQRLPETATVVSKKSAPKAKVGKKSAKINGKSEINSSDLETTTEKAVKVITQFEASSTIPRKSNDKKGKSSSTGEGKLSKSAKKAKISRKTADSESSSVKGGRKSSDPATKEDKKEAVKIRQNSAKIPSKETESDKSSKNNKADDAEEKSKKSARSSNKVEKVAIATEKAGKAEKTVKTLRKN